MSIAAAVISGRGEHPTATPPPLRAPDRPGRSVASIPVNLTRWLTVATILRRSEEENPRIIIPMSLALLAQVEEYRQSQGLKSRAAAIRELIEGGLLNASKRV